MFRLIAVLSDNIFAVHNTKTNILKFFNQDPSEFLTFSGLQENYNTSTFTSLNDFDSFISNYEKEVIHQESLKRAFNYISCYLKDRGRSCNETSYSIDLETTSLEAIFWRNNITSLVEHGKKDNDVFHCRVDFDRTNNSLSFYSNDNPDWLLNLESLIKNKLS